MAGTTKAARARKREREHKQAAKRRVKTALKDVRDVPVPLDFPPRPPEIVKRGRPTTLTPQVAKWVCNVIMNGYTQLDIVRAGGPALSTLRRWRGESEEFRSQLQEAIAMRTELHLEEGIEIADRTPPDQAAKARLQIEVRRHAMAHLLPHMFGKHVPGLGGSGDNDAGTSGLIAPIVQVFFGKGDDEPPMKDVTPPAERPQLVSREALVAAVKAEVAGRGPPVIEPVYGEENVSEAIDKSSQEAHSPEDGQGEDEDVFVGGR